MDCTELLIDMPTSYRSQSQAFSSHKHQTRVSWNITKCNGVITFVSDLYAGRFSDKKITKDCAIYDLLEPGDSIIAGRGFTLEDNLPEGTEFYLISHHF